MSMVHGDGEIETVDGSDPDKLNGSVVALGALGIVTSLTLDVEPTYDVRQDVYEDLPFDELATHFDEIATLAYSVSLFTDWRGPLIDQVWLKTRVAGRDPAEPPIELFGAVRASGPRHPIRRIRADACTPQAGMAGPWHHRLPHFRFDHTPSAGDELQTQYFVARADAAEAMSRCKHCASESPESCRSRRYAPSPPTTFGYSAYHRASAAIHFTWKPDWPAVRELLPAIETALAPFNPRPHWAKLFTLPADEVRSRYERLDDFVELAGRVDPDGKLRNEFLNRSVFG